MASLNALVPKLLLLLVALSCSATTRDITFPPVPGANAYQTSMGMSLDEVDIVTGSQFSGINTFAHLPYVYCFDERSDTPKYDIAFLGAPFDTVGATKSLPGLVSLPQSYSGIRRLYGGMYGKLLSVFGPLEQDTVPRRW